MKKKNRFYDNLFFWHAYQYNQKQISIHAAQVAFFIIVSFIPFLLFILALIQYTPLTQADIIVTIKNFIPKAFDSYIDQFLSESDLIASGTVLSITVLGTLWAGSKGFYGIVYELDKIYEVKKERNLFLCRIFSIFYTIIFTAVIVTSLLVLVYGNQIILWLSHYFPAIPYPKSLVFLLRSAIPFLLLALVFTSMFTWIPKRHSPFKLQLPGGILSSFLWISFSYLYSFYIDRYSSLSSIYGSLTYAILFIMWLYICCNIIFLGALFNRYLNTHENHLHFMSSLKAIPQILNWWLEKSKK